MNNSLSVDWVWVVAAAVFAFILRWVGLFIYHDVPFWWDEGHTYWMINGSYSSIIEKCESEVYPPLYFIFMKVIGDVFASDEFTLRFPSTVFACLTIVPLYFCVNFATGRIAARIATLVFALSPLATYYSLEARCYTLIAFLISVALCAFMCLVRKRSLVAFLVFTLSFAIALQVHHFTVFILPAPIIASLLVQNNKLKIFTIVIFAQIIAFAPYMYWFFVAVNAADGSAADGTKWIETTLWHGTYPATAPLDTLNAFGPFPCFPNYLWHTENSSSVPYFGLLIFAILVLMQCIFEKEATARRMLFVTSCWLLIPIVSSWLYSILRNPIYVVGRYDIIAFPAFIVMLSSGLRNLLKFDKGVFFLLFIAICGWDVFAVRNMYLHAKIPNRRHADYWAASKINDRAGPGDLVICIALRRPVIEYYVHGKLGGSLEFLSFPLEMNHHPCIYNGELYTRNNEHVGKLQAKLVAEKALIALRDGKHVYVASWSNLDDPLASYLFEQFKRTCVISMVDAPFGTELFEIKLLDNGGF